MNNIESQNTKIYNKEIRTAILHLMTEENINRATLAKMVTKEKQQSLLPNRNYSTVHSTVENPIANSAETLYYVCKVLGLDVEFHLLMDGKDIVRSLSEPVQLPMYTILYAMQALGIKIDIKVVKKKF